MKGIEIDRERCRGCELCLQFCSRGAIRVDAALNHDGYHPIRLEAEDECTGCALCALMCPHVAITKVYR